MSRDTLRRRLDLLLERATETRANSTSDTRLFCEGVVMGVQSCIDLVDITAAPQPNGHKVLLIVGNPLRGYSYHGPFESFADASAWGERHAAHAEFWLAPLLMDPPRSGPTLAVNNDGSQ